MGEEKRRQEPPTKNLFVAIILASTLISGCKVGPNYHKPVVQIPSAYHSLNENPQAQAQAASYADLRGGRSFKIPFFRN